MLLVFPKDLSKAPVERGSGEDAGEGSKGNILHLCLFCPIPYKSINTVYLRNLSVETGRGSREEKKVYRTEFRSQESEFTNVFCTSEWWMDNRV
jgi:hypothetical protein